MIDIPLLELKNWKIRRCTDVAIGPHDFQLNAGEIVTVMGPSGVGKTTWLMTLLGYEELGLEISGQRWQHGVMLKSGSIPKRALYIPQHLPFNPNWEVQEYLGRLPWGKKHLFSILPLAYQPARQQRVLEVLDCIGLLHRAKATASELSGGESQRAAIAQMLLLSPQILVGDEFISALDPGMALWILAECRQQIIQNGGAAIIALHDVQTASKVSDRILLFWPSTISELPWNLQNPLVIRNQSILYTLLCLARWSKDLPSQKSIQHLVNYLYQWIMDNSVWGDFSSIYQDNCTLLIDEMGEIHLIEVPIASLPPPAQAQGFNLTPVRFEDEKSIKIGVTVNAIKTITVLA
jgi:ABC-type multidrug transport system ATPase subunit